MLQAFVCATTLDVGKCATLTQWIGLVGRWWRCFMKIVSLGFLAATSLALAACSGTTQLPTEHDLDAGIGSRDGSFASTGTGGTSSVVGGAGSPTGTNPGGSVATGGTLVIGGTMAFPPPIGGGIVGGSIIGRPGGGNVEGPAPANCVSVSQTSADSDCQTELSCDNDWVYTYCYLQGDNDWYCNCNSNYRYLTFQVDSSDSSAVCAAISDVCSAAEAPSFTEAETCTTDYQSQGVDNCDLGKNCTRTVDLGDGITAQQNNYKSANCYNENGQLLCQCSNGQVYRSYQISGVGITTSCQVTMDLCDSDEALVFDEPAVCMTTYQDASDGYCNASQQCRSTTQVSDGITAVLDDYPYADCQDLGTGSALCSCSNNQGYMRFETESSASDLNTCTSATEICAAADIIDLSGPIDCSRSYQSASSQYCDAQLTCTQAGVLGGQDLLVYGDLYVNCSQPTSGGPWTCTCSSGQESASSEVDAADGWDVCSMYAESCPMAIDVQIGMTGNGGRYYGIYPFPLVP